MKIGVDCHKCLPCELRILGTEYQGTFTFACGNVVPLYEAKTMYGLTQLLGNAKFINREYGSVLYRGENELHDNLKPSLLRKSKKNYATNVHKLNEIKKRYVNDKEFANFVKIPEINSTHHFEGMFQHYGIKTRFLDLVDNHWVALWMGLYKCESFKSGKKYFYHYAKRTAEFIDYVNCEQDDSNMDLDDAKSKKAKNQQSFYQYIYLVAVPRMRSNKYGVYSNKNYILLDLRQALPSTCLRPHVQHAWVVRKNVGVDAAPETYDMASEVVGVIKIRIDRAANWLGDGELLSQQNMFPNQAYDRGYDLLLRTEDEFLSDTDNQIYKYI